MQASFRVTSDHSGRLRAAVVYAFGPCVSRNCTRRSGREERRTQDRPSPVPYARGWCDCPGQCRWTRGSTDSRTAAPCDLREECPPRGTPFRTVPYAGLMMVTIGTPIRAKQNAIPYWVRALLSMLPTDCHALSRREAGRGLSSVYLVHERVGIYRWTMDTRWRRRSWRGERERRAGSLYRPRTALGIDERPREEYRPAFGSCTEGGRQTQPEKEDV